MNNRQANGRRRGRGGQQQRPQGNSGRQDTGNRIDNRSRGNAAQLLEKYKALARDSQMSGDRVNTEYYLQFADHYFRVLSETRTRFEEANPQAPRRPIESNDLNDDDFDFEGDGNRSYEQPREEPRQQQAEPQQQRDYREPREARGNDRDRDTVREDRGPREERNRDDREPRRNGRSNAKCSCRFGYGTAI